MHFHVHADGLKRQYMTEKGGKRHCPLLETRACLLSGINMKLFMGLKLHAAKMKPQGCR